MFENKYISFGDLIDLYHKFRIKGIKKVISQFNLSKQARTISKWTNVSPTSDFWIIPEIQKRWNQKCSGDPNIEYEDYVVQKYLKDKSGLRLLSVGPGLGNKERNFAKYPNFHLLEGIDLTPNKVILAKKLALKNNFQNINYLLGDFKEFDFENVKYDVVLFNSSLHHFDKIFDMLKNNVIPILNDDGYLVIFEYVGPNKFQWTQKQLDRANQLLLEIPDKYRLRQNSKKSKNIIYRPGLLRMSLVDPSEAIESESIVPSLHQLFDIVDEKQIGWDILHLLLKDIAHNFLNDNDETKYLLSYLFEQEDKFVSENGRSDAIFGIYQKKKQFMGLSQIIH